GEVERFIELALLDFKERQILEGRCIRRMKFAVALLDLEGAQKERFCFIQLTAVAQDEGDVAETFRGFEMVRSEFRLAKFQRAPGIDLGLVVFSKVPVNETQIARDESEIDVIRPERFLFRFQDALKDLL